MCFEAPPATRPQFEHKMFGVIQRVMRQNTPVLTIVQPSLRRKSNKALWISKWNQLQHTPFKFHQTCSCQTGNAVPGVHLTCYVGSSIPISISPCSEVPTLSTTSQASLNCFGGTIKYLFASLASSGRLPKGEIERSNPEARLSPDDPQMLCRPAAEFTSGVRPLGPSRHQTQLSTDQNSFANENLISTENGNPSPHGVSHDSAHCAAASTQEAASFPTDAKEREKNRRKEEKAQGIEKRLSRERKSWRITMMIVVTT